MLVLADGETANWYTQADASNVYLQDGKLHIWAVQTITAGKNPKAPSTISFTSGRIHTQDKFAFTYGTVEVSTKIPGVWFSYYWMA